ncbi:MAG: TRAP transporter substrate-binding protein [Defluviitaleaceae bacterium]|nr:TRAP transporter substrate-binding protein [Defluviitaleaceae bacterium]
MKMKKAISVTAMMMTTVFALTACAGGGGAAAPAGADGETPITLLAGSAAAPGTQVVRHLETASRMLEEMGSSITLELQFSSVLGTEREMSEQILMGSNVILSTSDIGISPLIPEIAFVNFPGLFADYSDVEANLWNGWAGEVVTDMVIDAGYKLFGIADNDFRWISNSVRPVNTFEELAGLSIRVPENELLIDFFTRAGALPISIAFGEIATALQQGVVDGQENGPVLTLTSGFSEFNNYLTASHHGYSLHVVIMSPEVFNSMSPRQQQELTEVMEYAIAEQQYYVVNHMRPAVVAELAGTPGIEIVEFNEDFYGHMVRIGREMAASPRWIELLGQDLLDRMFPN